MSFRRSAWVPTGSLPSLRAPEDLTEVSLTHALRELHALYCPLPSGLYFRFLDTPKKILDNLPTPAAIDSGYVSGDDDDDDDDDDYTEYENRQLLLSDDNERNFAARWLTTLIDRSNRLQLVSENVAEVLIDDASSILTSLTGFCTEIYEDTVGLSRDFSFRVSLNDSSLPASTVNIKLNDCPLTGADHTDVGLQTWGASIVLSKYLCSSPAAFGLTQHDMPKAPYIVELGAGTGLVSLVLAAILPIVGIHDATVVATDYHPAVLQNLRDNVELNFPGLGNNSVQTCLLDWAIPHSMPPMDRLAQMLFATDVVYELEHAVLLRDCASRYLAPDGIFWMIVSVRGSGRFQGLSDTVETAFKLDFDHSESQGPMLQILDRQRLEKKSGIGRSDEVEYILFRIGWVEMDFEGDVGTIGASLLKSRCCGTKC